MTVAALSRELTALEEAHWIARYRKQPWGDLAADARNALIAQLIHNTNAPKGKGKPMEDFMLFKDKPKQSGVDPVAIRDSFERMLERQQR